MKGLRATLAFLILLLSGCQAAVPVEPTFTPPPPTPAPRTELKASTLLNGGDLGSPLPEAALTPPAEAATAKHAFEGRLELGEGNGQMEVLRGALSPEYASLPKFDFALVQESGYLVPVQRGLIIADHPVWNLILEPGRVWQEDTDQGYSRASLPFALVPKGSNSAFNGTLTFLFDDRKVSHVWYQVTQETTPTIRANLWGMLEATYHPGKVPDSQALRARFQAELSRRMPVKPIEALAKDYPGVDVSAFGRGVTPEDMTWYGLVVKGVNYLGGCRTRFGTYPYCESMRASSFSTAKSAFVSLALMRLAQKYDPEIGKALIQEYVPEAASSAGDWERVTFDNVLDMASGNYVSASYMEDDNSQAMGLFFAAQPYAKRIALAFQAPHQAEPGTIWVYRTSDTFILTRAMHNYLQRKEGPQADIFDFVVEEIYRPLGLGPGAFSTLRTADNDWQGQAEGGYGLWWIPDDIAKISTFLNVAGGKIGGEQVLHPGYLAASLQRDESDRGVVMDWDRSYNNSFWANSYNVYSGYGCVFWVPKMFGYSGNVVALFPNGITYYYFSDNREFTWNAALEESSKIAPLCPTK